ncbi:hypothetical protein AALP_AA4G107500 [Arabis alpina]|uniref:XS domain-containing protein n=1 Tax=Arabis alpina TaxID=50452 RepID=A0A087H2G9_ARAAL|nr:hypothetical protein AALP_AA4G107500 [Arabis alpina]
MKEKECCDEEKFVFPWVGVLANLPTEIDNKTGQRIGKSLSTLRDELTRKGFNPTRVAPIWNFEGHSGFALVEFKKDFGGFENAMKFERSYELDGHGKIAYECGIHLSDEKLYGWVAREDDYNEGGIVGKRLKKKGVLQSLSQIQAEEERKMKQLVESMSQSIEMKKICKQELEEKLEKTLDQTSCVLEDLALHYLHLNRTYEEKETEKMQEHVQRLYQQIQLDHEESMLELEKKRKKLEERARKIEQQANINEAEMEKSRLEREMKEKEELHERIMEMEAKLNDTQELELKMEIEKHMVGSDGDALVKLAKTRIELEAKETVLQSKMMTLTQKERMTNYEYQDARKEMIELWNSKEDLMSGENIRVKIMGQLNPEPFIAAVKRKHGGSKSRIEKMAMELCSWWEGHIRDVHWRPFKVDVSDGEPKIVVDKNDEELVKLKNNYGQEVYNEVVRARLEKEEPNASELWNYEQNRKATLEEAAEVMLKVRSSRKRI